MISNIIWIKIEKHLRDLIFLYFFRERDVNGSDFDQERDGTRSHFTGVGQDGIFFPTLAQDWDGTGFFLQEWDGTGVKIHQNVIL